MIDKLRRLDTFARTGWFARGVVYCLLALIALTGANASEASPEGVFRAVYNMPGGPVLLVLLAVGVALYGAYRLYGAALDSEGQGDSAKGIAIRIGYAGSGIAHFALAYVAVRLAVYRVDGDSDMEQAAAGMMLNLPLGGSVLGAVGLCFLAAGAHQAIKAWRADFTKDYALSAPDWVVPVGQVGLAARAVVFSVIGLSLLQAGWSGSAGAVKGLGDALSSLNEHPDAYLVVAAGLFLFGIQSFFDARWRHILDEDMIARLKASVS